MDKDEKYRRLANRNDESLRFMLPANLKAEIKTRGRRKGRTMSAEVLNVVIDAYLHDDKVNNS